MQTVLGIFPIQKELPPQVLDYLLDASTYLNFKQPTDRQDTTARAMSERMADLFLNSFSEKETTRISDVYKNNFEQPNKRTQQELDYLNQQNTMSLNVYYDVESGEMKRIDKTAPLAPEINKTFTKAYNDSIYGASYKQKEYNIVNNDSEEQSGGMKYSPKTIDAQVVANKEVEGWGTDEIFAPEVEDNLQAMRRLQTFFLAKERVDLRELLQNYFKFNTNPEDVLPESVTLLEFILNKYQDTTGNIVKEYLRNRCENRIPLQYQNTLF